MIDGLTIEGFAIVSRNGMLAGADGLMPNSLKFDEDQRFLDEQMDAAALLVHGKKSHEGQDNSHKRKRLLLSRSGGPFSTTPFEPNTWLWSPVTTPFPEVCKALGIKTGVVAILGGTAAYDMFLPFYDTFHWRWRRGSICPAACRCSAPSAKATRPPPSCRRPGSNSPIRLCSMKRTTCTS